MIVSVEIFAVAKNHSVGGQSGGTDIGGGFDIEYYSHFMQNNVNNENFKDKVKIFKRFFLNL